MFKDRVRKRLGVNRANAVARSLNRQEVSVRDDVSKRFAVFDREHGVGRSVDDESGRFDRRKGAAVAAALGEMVMVSSGCEVTGTLNITSYQFAHLRLFEWLLASREHERVLDTVVDHRLRG